jgi:hypothetical protein
MVLRILSAIVGSALGLLGLYIGLSNSEPASVRFGWTMAIIGGILALLALSDLLRVRRNLKKHPEK